MGSPDTPILRVPGASGYGLNHIDGRLNHVITPRIRALKRGPNMGFGTPILSPSRGRCNEVNPYILD